MEDYSDDHNHDRNDYKVVRTTPLESWTLRVGLFLAVASAGLLVCDGLTGSDTVGVRVVLNGCWALLVLPVLYFQNIRYQDALGARLEG